MISKAERKAEVNLWKKRNELEQQIIDKEERSLEVFHRKEEVLRSNFTSVVGRLVKSV